MSGPSLLPRTARTGAYAGALQRVDQADVTGVQDQVDALERGRTAGGHRCQKRGEWVSEMTAMRTRPVCSSAGRLRPPGCAMTGRQWAMSTKRE